MKRILCQVGLLPLLLGAFGWAEEPSAVQKRYVIGFKQELVQRKALEGVSIAEARAVLEEPIRKQRLNPQQTSVPGAFTVVDATPVQISEVATRLAESIDYIEEDVIYKKSLVPNDPIFTDPEIAGFLWGLLPQYGINATGAWDVTQGAEDQVIGVVDTGIYKNHGDLTAALYKSSVEVANGKDDDGNGFVDDVSGYNFSADNPFVDDTDGHGTIVSGIVAASGNDFKGTVGVTWRSKVMPLKVFGADGYASAAAVARAIDYAADLKKRGVKISVLNLSLGSAENSLTMERAVSRAREAGILLVCTAGNESQDSYANPSYPAGYAEQFDNILSVGAVNSDGALAWFSNYGKFVHVVAPGEDILSTALPYYSGGYTLQYTVASGTSVAAPYVSGTVALMASVKSLKPAEYVDLIKKTTRQLPLVLGKVSFGGIIDAGAAVRATQAFSRKFNLQARVSLNGSALPGVTLTTTIGTVSTDGSGAYAFGGVTEGTVVQITPSAAGYQFTPASVTVAIDSDRQIEFAASLAPLPPVVTPTPIVPTVAVNHAPTINSAFAVTKPNGKSLKVTVAQASVFDADNNLAQVTAKISVRGVKGTKVIPLRVSSSGNFFTGFVSLKRSKASQKLATVEIIAVDSSGLTSTLSIGAKPL